MVIQFDFKLTGKTTDLRLVTGSGGGYNSITQIRLDRKNWEKIIRLMQEKNGLWPLGQMEPKILDYLEKNYGLTDEHHNPKIRRPLLD